MTTLTVNSELNLKIVKNLSKNYFNGDKVLQDLTVTQAILESSLLFSPPSQLALKYNNLFGQKPSETIPELAKGTNGIISMPTHEWSRGKELKVYQAFLSNKEIEDSFEQREILFNSLDRYDNLFGLSFFNVAAELVRQDGYATDPSYTQELIDTYNRYVKE